MATKHGLARGLDALLPETDLPAGVTEIAVSRARSAIPISRAAPLIRRRWRRWRKAFGRRAFCSRCWWWKMARATALWRASGAIARRAWRGCKACHAWCAI